MLVIAVVIVLVVAVVEVKVLVVAAIEVVEMIKIILLFLSYNHQFHHFSLSLSVFTNATITHKQQLKRATNPIWPLDKMNICCCSDCF